MLHIQAFLREGHTLEELAAPPYAISAKAHPQYPLYLLKYDQIESDFSNDIVKECRGIVLDRDNDWNVVNYSMSKFHNYGEQLASNIDWSTARIFTKEDGSLIQLFVYDGKWMMATSGSFGDGSVGDYGFSFSELWYKTFAHKLPPVDCGCSFFFELCTPYNKIVVRHTEPHVVLLGGRNLTTMKELSLEEAHAYFPECKKVDSHPFASFNECIAAMEKISPLDQEGLVVCDGFFNRVKIKSAAYVALHHLKDSLGSSRRALVGVVLNNEVDEVCISFPEYKEILFEARDRLNTLVSELEQTYDAVRHIESQKAFALAIVGKCRCTSALFALRAGKTQSIRHYLNDMHIDSVMEMLGYRTEK
jgi:hypothetical protein